MRTIAGPLQAELAAKPSRLARVYKLVLLSGDTFRFTEHNRNIPSDDADNPYLSSNAVSSQAIEASTGDIAVNTDLTMNYVDGLSRHLAVGGAYDNATVIIDLLSWANPSVGSINLITGTLMQKSTNNQSSGTFSVKGLVRQIDGYLVEAYGPECRANFCDSRCKLDIADYTYDFTVTAVTDDRRIFDCDIVGSLPTGEFNQGRLRFDGDALDIEIQAHSFLGGTSHRITLGLPRVADLIEVGNTGDISKGCNKTLTRCMEFDNVINRRAEDYLPGPDIAIKKATSDF